MTGDDAATTDQAHGLLERLGLHRPELRAWALYDWANSAFVLTVTTIFPIYFLKVAGADLAPTAATQRFAWTTAIALAIVAVIAPILGALADARGIRKRLLGIFLALGALATASLFFVERGDWLLATCLFGVASIGAQGSFAFYDSLLPHVARLDEMDRVSTTGYAVGYLGSAILLALQMLWIQWPERFGLPAGTLPTRLAFLSVSIWWVVFSIPLFRRVREPARRIAPGERPDDRPLATALARLAETFRALRTYRHALLMLISFLIYNDGIGTIIRMAAIYGAEIGIEDSALFGAILLAQLVGIPFAFAFGALAGRIGPKRAILLGLAIYVGITAFAYGMRTATHFYLLALAVGTVQGGCQALSRSVFGSMIPRHRSSEFFGFYGVLEKFAGILGPSLFGLTIALTGSSRTAILSVITFFVVGAALLSRVDIAAGRRAARAAEAELLLVA